MLNPGPLPRRAPRGGASALCTSAIMLCFLLRRLLFPSMLIAMSEGLGGDGAGWKACNHEGQRRKWCTYGEYLVSNNAQPQFQQRFNV